MDAHNSDVVSVSNSFDITQMEKEKTHLVNQKSGGLSEEIEIRKEIMVEEPIGVLEVYIHEAREIHNICIYHKQDVYAKVCLTSDPENTFSTQIINGGGRNPVFNESIKLKVRTIESSLKCEVWMLSRVRNYLEDQLLGFALIPISEILIGNGMLAQEFSLTSSDLFHSPAGFVQLSLSYNGDSPEVLAIPDPRQSLIGQKTMQDSEIPDSFRNDYDKIEFPDPQIVNDDNQMVSEYYEIQSSNLDSHSSESLGGESENDNHYNSNIGARVAELASSIESITVPKVDTPGSSVSTNGSPFGSVTASSQTIPDTPGASKSPNSEQVSPFKDDNGEKKDDKVNEALIETESSTRVPSKSFGQIKVNIEPEETMVQQDIVNMYMKSMQEFTESLAKMKLPLDKQNETDPGKENSSSDQKLQGSKEASSRVFYGSRAFF